MKRNELGMNSVNYERLYNVWRNMIARCYNPQNDRYYTYGKRGITVCDEWRYNFRKFARWAYENGWNANLSIERKNLNLPYCPANCEFITMKQQARNKTSNVLITYNGETRCVAEWCEILGLKAKTVYKRIYDGHTEPEIILYNGDIRYREKRCLYNG